MSGSFAAWLRRIGLNFLRDLLNALPLEQREMGPEGVPMPYLHSFQEGRLIWSETGRLLFGDEAQGRRARGSVSRLPTLAPDGQAYYVFATATLWQFAGLTATDWKEGMEQVVLVTYFLELIVKAVENRDAGSKKAYPSSQE